VFSERLRRYSYPPYKLDKRDPEDVLTTPLKSAHLFLPPPEVDFYLSAVEFKVILHPCVEIYVKLRKQLGLELEDFGKVGSDKDGKFAEKINEFSTTLSGKYKESSYKRRITVIEQQVNEMYKSASELVKNLQAREKGFNVVRLDLWFEPGLVVLGEYQLQDALKTMLKHRKYDVISNIVGVVSKTQFSAYWGFGLNVTFFMSPDFQVRGGNIGGSIGSIWQNVICNGQGVYLDCSNHPNQYKRAGIGLYGADSTLQVQQLLSSFAFLAKVSTFMSVGSGMVSRLLI
jgi:hypothetical protein